MQISFQKYGIALLASTLLLACSRVPDKILSEREMQRVMVDMQLAEAIINGDYNTYKEDSIKAALFYSVFRKHNITQATYDSSVVWYGKNLAIYMEVYDRVLKDLSQQITKLGDVQADASPSSNQDSVNVWPRRSFITFQPKAPFNGVIFELKPETDYNSGSIFAFSMDVWGLNPAAGHTPEVRLSAIQGDTTISVTTKITRDGRAEAILKTLPTRRVREVHGYIRMNSTDSSYHKIYLDHISLIRYNYGSPKFEVKKDTLSTEAVGDSLKLLAKPDSLVTEQKSK